MAAACREHLAVGSAHCPAVRLPVMFPPKDGRAHEAPHRGGHSGPISIVIGPLTVARGPRACARNRRWAGRASYSGGCAY